MNIYSSLKYLINNGERKMPGLEWGLFSLNTPPTGHLVKAKEFSLSSV
jgi:hypothetical protein